MKVVPVAVAEPRGLAHLRRKVENVINQETRVVAGIHRELGIQPQHKVHAPERFGSLQIPEWSKTRQVKVILDDECTKFRMNLFPQGPEPSHFTADALFNLDFGFQWFGEFRYVVPGGVDKNNVRL